MSTFKKCRSAWSSTDSAAAVCCAQCAAVRPLSPADRGTGRLCVCSGGGPTPPAKKEESCCCRTVVRAGEEEAKRCLGLPTQGTTGAEQGEPELTRIACRRHKNRRHRGENAAAGLGHIRFELSWAEVVGGAKAADPAETASKTVSEDEFRQRRAWGWPVSGILSAGSTGRA